MASYWLLYQVEKNVKTKWIIFKMAACRENASDYVKLPDAESLPDSFSWRIKNAGTEPNFDASIRVFLTKALHRIRFA